LTRVAESADLVLMRMLGDLWKAYTVPERGACG